MRSKASAAHVTASITRDEFAFSRPPPRIRIFLTDLLEGETNLLELIAALDASIIDDEIVDGAKAALDKLQPANTPPRTVSNSSAGPRVHRVPRLKEAGLAFIEAGGHEKGMAETFPRRR